MLGCHWAFFGRNLTLHDSEDAGPNLGDLYAESGQTLQGSFSAAAAAAAAAVARSRLYRSQILQVNPRWKALAGIYTIHSFAPVSNLNFFVKICNFLANFARFLLILRKFLTLGPIFWNL